MASGDSAPGDMLLTTPAAERLMRSHVTHLSTQDGSSPASNPNLLDVSPQDVLSVGLAALSAFLQANVTGPVLPLQTSQRVQSLFAEAWRTSADNKESALRLRRSCLAHLEVDGVSPYAHTPHIELFSLARYAVDLLDDSSSSSSSELSPRSLSWHRLRLNTWHYRITAQPSLGAGSNFSRSSQWTDVPSLAAKILEGIEALHEFEWPPDDKALFLVEAAAAYITLGRHEQARDSLQQAADARGFAYALSGALGRRTRFQERDVSQLVVLARSNCTNSSSNGAEPVQGEARPDALRLNDDTLLEDIRFSKDTQQDRALPPALADMTPDDQPQLDAVDEIILLTEATIKDAFSPLDGLTSEEILPFAVRVLSDQSVNWQIYTQALLVRSRIELHRSRTVERGVLQLQAVADQVIADTSYTSPSEPAKPPAIHISSESTPTTFLPAPTQSESAPAHLRLRYVHALASPPRWHLESELAHSWASVGSLSSALEIFKRLRLWAEVALCLAGAGSEDKARAIIRWRLFTSSSSSFSSSSSASASSDPDEDLVGDISTLIPSDFTGPERPPPPDAPRLWCILGDLDNDPAHYRRAWTVSHNRYARAQRSLGEYSIAQSDWPAALDAYAAATRVHRTSPEMWSRLGDISLRLGRFEEAANAFTRSIACATDSAGGEGAKTWSNLGSALWSLYLENESSKTSSTSTSPSEEFQSQSQLLAQSLSAYKRGAAIAHDNWRIWDNVLTLAARISPLPVPDIILALTHIIRIRNTEDAIDPSLLSALLHHVVFSPPSSAAPNPSSSQPLSSDMTQSSTSTATQSSSSSRLLIHLIEDKIVPLITSNHTLWSLVARLRSHTANPSGAIDAAQRAWRAALARPYVSEKPAWDDAVQRTDELVSLLENLGPDVDSLANKWRGQARSAVRTVMGGGRECWEGSEGWITLERLMEGLR